VPDPDALPYQLQERETFGVASIAVDLDRDGIDERIYWDDRHTRTGGAQQAVMAIVTQEGAFLSQDNYPMKIGAPIIRDVHGDARREVLMPIQRDSLLWLQVTGPDALTLYQFLLLDAAEIEGRPPVAWDPLVRDVFAADVDGNGVRELVSVLSTNFALQPRGIQVNRVPSGEYLGRLTIGAPIVQATLADVDGDARPELIAATAAFLHGGDAGGFDDRHAYVMAVRLAPQPEVLWSTEVGGETSGAFIHIADFDADGDDDLLIVATNAGESGRMTRLELREPGTWRILRSREVGDALSGPAVVDLDRDARPELVMVNQSREEVWVFDGAFERVGVRPLKGARQVASAADVDGDGIAEIAVKMSTGGFVLLSPALDVKAAYPKGWLAGTSVWTSHGETEVYRRGLGAAPLLMVDDEGGTSTVELVPNPWYQVMRYGPATGLGAVVLLLMAGGTGIARLRADRRLLSELHDIPPAGPPTGQLCIDRRGRVRWLNPTFRSWLVPYEDGPPRHVDDLEAYAGEVADFASDVLAGGSGDARSVETPVTIDGTSFDALLSAVSFVTRSRGDPHWLIRVEDRCYRVDADEARTWAMMAERVAHGLKNPLTSMLLTVQRLQTEYRERAPAVAGRLDRYSHRVEEGIRQLRTMTANFLKFVNVDQVELVETDLHRFVGAFADSLHARLPPDIRLKLELDDRLPPVRLDREQMDVVLDNLVANSMNAMPDGGTITLACGTARGVLLPETERTRDYVEIEVLDTGQGIAPEVRARLFEPGFSTEKDGSGLGLAIVRKIVRDHGGEVRVESEVGTGSAFTVYLPLE
jgi:signal transduction histidine kinase